MSSRSAVVEREMGDVMWTVHYYEDGARIGSRPHHWRWSARLAARRYLAGLSGPHWEEIR